MKQTPLIFMLCIVFSFSFSFGKFAWGQIPVENMIRNITESEKSDQQTDINPVFETMDHAILQTLDKVTGRTSEIDVAIGEDITFGKLYLSVKTCRKTPPIEKPEAAAFIEIWQEKTTPAGNQIGVIKPAVPQSEWVFSGWMFASSPSVSAMDHPVYDVWLKDCRRNTKSKKSNDDEVTGSNEMDLPLDNKIN